MNQHFQKALLTLFALLQCVSPIAHAHIGGDNDAAHVHQSSTHASAGDSRAEAPIYQTISTPQAYRLRDSAIQNHPEINPTFNWIDFDPINTALVPPYKPSITLSSPSHLSPWSQAPPHLSNPA